MAEFAYRVTTVSRLDGKPVTKKFKSHDEAAGVFDAVSSRDSIPPLYAVLLKMKPSGYANEDAVYAVVATYTPAHGVQRPGA